MEWTICNIPRREFISFTSDVQVIKSIQEEKYPQLDKAKVRIFESLPVRHWTEWTNGSFSHVSSMSSTQRETTDIMAGEPYDCPGKAFPAEWKRFAASRRTKTVWHITSKKVEGICPIHYDDVI